MVKNNAGVLWSPRYGSLDIWRGVVCLLVVVFHVTSHDRTLAEVPYGVTRALATFRLGVPMFFVISGYCIAATCDATARRPRSFKWYVGRRFRRIFPPYWICLSLTAVGAATGVAAGPGVGAPAGMTGWQWLGNITLTERWRPRLVGGDQHFLLEPAWTLCFEEQFYLVCGLILAAARHHFFLATVIVTVVSVPMAMVNWSGAVNLHGFFFDGHWLEFAAGIHVYHCLAYGNARVSVAALFAAAVVTVALRVGLPQAIVNGYSRSAFLDGMTVALIFAAALVPLAKWDSRTASAPILGPLKACGVMCYSLYLTHQPVILAVRRAAVELGVGGTGPTIGFGEAVATVIVTIAAGAVFYWLVERRFLNRPMGPLAGQGEAPLMPHTDRSSNSLVRPPSR